MVNTGYVRNNMDETVYRTRTSGISRVREANSSEGINFLRQKLLEVSISIVSADTRHSVIDHLGDLNSVLEALLDGYEVTPKEIQDLWYVKSRDHGDFIDKSGNLHIKRK